MGRINLVSPDQKLLNRFRASLRQSYVVFIATLCIGVAPNKKHGMLKFLVTKRLTECSQFGKSLRSDVG